MKSTTLLLSILFSILVVSAWPAFADERFFTYSYETTILPKGTLELEQWITNQNGKDDGDYSRWNLRTEFEYGFTERYMSALYLNLDSIRSEGVTGIEDDDGASFKGISWENIYQIINPHLNVVGLAVYGELTSDGLDYELETKLLLSKSLDDILLAANATYEAEWEREDNKTAKEATLEFTLGGAYRLTPQWSIGVEARNKSAYPGDLNLTGQEFQTWSVGPNIHYGAPKWWATLTLLPQVWGNGDGASGGRQLIHEEAIEVRLIAGVLL